MSTSTTHPTCRYPKTNQPTLRTRSRPRGMTGHQRYAHNKHNCTLPWQMPHVSACTSIITRYFALLTPGVLAGSVARRPIRGIGGVKGRMGRLPQKWGPTGPKTTGLESPSMSLVGFFSLKMELRDGLGAHVSSSELSLDAILAISSSFRSFSNEK